MERKNYKTTQNIMLFFTLLVLFVGFYIENVYNLTPCPLCLMQRFCIFIIGFFCFISFSFKTQRGALHLAILQILVAILGLYFSSRQIWLQSLPLEEGKMCLPGVEAVAHYFSNGNIFKTFLWGSTSCSEVAWTGYYGLSMPVWAAIYFGIMILFNSLVAIIIKLRLKRDNKLAFDSHKN
ncbi:MAG: hypothetical protein A3E88_07700 [Legionellales bacterium RIFCSPHIGHO2_12_FULL_35_11]|nr:MAG: hypothetical protein A3E88_07700 [Legionellales bacterium RIFCSPHIGHO2_12_FULL_35_11]